MSDIKARILLVEDDTDLRETMAESLALYGIAVTAVADGRGFYAALNQDNYAAALIDLGLPDLDGYHLVTYLRNNTGMKIIVTTARTAPADRVRGYICGADLYLTKPVNFEELAAALLSITTHRAVAPAASETWRLDRYAMKLSSPGGQDLLLTPKEYRFLSLLSGANGDTLRRDVVLAAVYGATDDAKSRALDVLTSRLRSRFLAATGELLPLLTEPGVGFRFTALLSAN